MSANIYTNLNLCTIISEYLNSANFTTFLLFNRLAFSRDKNEQYKVKARLNKLTVQSFSLQSTISKLIVLLVLFCVKVGAVILM